MRKINRVKVGKHGNNTVTFHRAKVEDSVASAHVTAKDEAERANVSPSAVMGVSKDGYATGDEESWPDLKTPETPKTSVPEAKKVGLVTKETVKPADELQD